MMLIANVTGSFCGGGDLEGATWEEENGCGTRMIQSAFLPRNA